MYTKYTGFKGFEGSKESHNQINKILDPYEIIRDCDCRYGIAGEIFTPVWVAKQMLAQIPVEEWSNPNLKVLDPCCKSGIFLLEAYHFLMKGLSEKFPDPVKRRTHIIFNQLYGVTTCGTGATLTRKVLFGDPIIKGHIGTLDSWAAVMKNASSAEYNTKIFQLTKGNTTNDWKDTKDMKFDIIIGNPPYQDDNGGGLDRKAAMPMYQYFVQRAIDLKPRYVSMIIPSRWMSGGKSVLDKFRADMIESKHLGSIYNFERSKEIFNGVDIAGGVQYFLYEGHNTFDTVNMVNCSINEDTKQMRLRPAQRDLGAYKYRGRGKEGADQYMIVSDNKAAGVVDRVNTVAGPRMDTTVLGIMPFGIKTDFYDSAVYSEAKSIRVVCSGNLDTYTDLENITKNKELIPKWKVCTGKVNPDRGGVNGSLKSNVITRPFLLKPNEVCSITYLVIDSFDTQVEAENCLSYISTKFARYLAFVALGGINITSRNFMFVPVQDYNHPWTDKQLYDKYGLSPEEIEVIEDTIKSWDN